MMFLKKTRSISFILTDLNPKFRNSIAGPVICIIRYHNKYDNYLYFME